MEDNTNEVTVVPYLTVLTILLVMMTTAFVYITTSTSSIVKAVLAGISVIIVYFSVLVVIFTDKISTIISTLSKACIGRVLNKEVITSTVIGPSGMQTRVSFIINVQIKEKVYTVPVDCDDFVSAFTGMEVPCLLKCKLSFPIKRVCAIMK